MHKQPSAKSNALLAAICAALTASTGVTANAQSWRSVDPTVRPGDDFYAYANGPWLRATELPDGAASVDTTALLRATNAERVRGLIEDAARHRGARSLDAGKIGDYYAARHDTTTIEAKGFGPIAPELAAIAAIDDRRALSAYLGRTIQLDDGGDVAPESLWALWIHQGFHDGRRHAAHVLQGGLGMGDQADYLDSSPDYAKRRTAYRAHVARVLALAGLTETEARADGVLALETAIAATHASRADTDDVFKTDNSWRKADFIARAPGVDWEAYFAAAGLGPSTNFVVWQPQAVIGGAKLVATEPLAIWKDYLTFHRLEHYAAVLPKALGEADRAFGIGLPDAIKATQDVFGDAIGRLYVDRYVPPGTKIIATAMVENIRSAFRARLTATPWMTAETRAKALDKLAGLRIGLVHPDRWVDYASLVVARDDAFGNLQRADAFAYRRQLARLTQPVDPNAWPDALHPQTVGAILDISPNSMEFAAVLQPPYFDAVGDLASNYGSAGAGLAHEVSHSFDAVGDLYDGEGRLEPWKTEADKAGDAAAIAPLAAQLDICCPTPDLCANGQRVLGETAADLVGLRIAHEAYRRALRGKPDVVKDGLTGEQRFFIAFAQRWRRVQTDAALRRQIATDNHAPPQCRANLVRNLDAWVTAFGIKPGDKLYLPPEARLR